MIEKYATVNLNQTKESENKTYLINDYCNIAQSQITIQFFENIFEYFNSSDTQKDQCLILDDIFNNYYSQFIKIFEFNKDSFIIHALYVKKISKQIHY